MIINNAMIFYMNIFYNCNCYKFIYLYNVIINTIMKINVRPRSTNVRTPYIPHINTHLFFLFSDFKTI